MATAEAPKKTKETFSKENIEKIASEPEGAEGTLTLDLPGGVTIDLDFESEVEDGKCTLTAVNQVEEGDDPYSVSVGDIVELIDPHASLPEVLSSVKFELNYIFFHYHSGGEESGRKWMLGVDVSVVAPDLSKMPLLGGLLEDLHLKLVDDLLLLYASAPFTKEEIDELDEKLPEDKPKISIPKGAKDETEIIHKGVNVSGHLSVSASAGMVLPSPKKDGDGDGDGGGDSGSAGDSSDLDIELWFKVQKKVGPLSIDKIGVGFDLDKLQLDFMLDAGLEVGGFSLYLDDFRIGSPLTHFEPEFDLEGIAVAYENSDIELAGALVKLKGKDDDSGDYTEYVGEVKVAIGDQITMLAIGGYANFDHHPSFFAYGFLGIPIPIVPTDFEIDGFALGLGFNQAIHAPMANEVDQFPLVAQVMPGAPEPDMGIGEKDKKSQAKALIEQFENLTESIFPQLDTFFGAAGIKVSGYEMLDAFILAILEAGHGDEIDVMGMGSVTVPIPKTGEGEESVPTLAYLGLEFIVSIAISDGYFGACAGLTSDSYIFASDIHPSGGFAAYVWWNEAHAGDFVISIGGYNPRFDVPAHYPSVPRVEVPCGAFFPVFGIQTTVSGYLALCPHAIMAGIGFEASYSIWIATVSLSLDLDLLVSWKPFYVEACVSVTLRLSAHIWFIHITIEVGASLCIWGPILYYPPYAKRLEIHAGPFKLSLTDPPWAGSHGSGPSPIDWPEFKDSFLPHSGHAVVLRVNQGLVREVKQGDGSTLLVVNPKDLRITADSLIPVAKSGIGDTEPGVLAGANTEFGVAPMGIACGGLETVQTITIRRDGEDHGIEDEFAFTPILRRFPTGMWGGSLTPELNGPRFVEGVLSGFCIAPKNPPRPGETRDLAVKKLQFDPTTVDYSYGSLLPFATLHPSSSEDALLEAMGFRASETSS